MGAQQQGADATQGRWITIPRTLCFVFHQDRVLLLKRAAHKRVFPNQYNGLGGHIERDEDPYTSARREIQQESGLTVRDLRLRAVHQIDAGGDSGIMLFVFSAVSDSLEVQSDEREGTLHWVTLAQLATLDAVEDIRLVLQRIAQQPPNGPPDFVHVRYDEADQIQLRYAEHG
jgi:8-oxo-dGTP diphosphatase